MGLRLSVLDQSVATAGRGHDETLRNTLALAQQAEAWGYHRFWVSEHHSHPSIVGSAPEVLMAAINTSGAVPTMLGWLWCSLTQKR